MVVYILPLEASEDSLMTISSLLVMYLLHPAAALKMLAAILIQLITNATSAATCHTKVSVDS